MNILPIAAPSCVLLDTVANNAMFLASRVEEVGLCFFEAFSCLNYTEADLPQSLASLPLRWHIHLPVDLPWENDDGSKAARLALQVAEKAAYLKPRFAVLHPPVHISAQASMQEKLLLSFVKAWYAQSNIPILLENIAGAPLVNLGNKLFNLPNAPIGVCLDVGHMLGFEQDALLHSQLLECVQLVHWSAPGKKDEHLSLDCFTAHEYKIVQELAKKLPRDICHMLEIFNWNGIEKSYPIFKQIWNLTHG